MGHGGEWIWLVGAMVEVSFFSSFFFSFFLLRFVVVDGCGWWWRWWVFVGCGMGGRFLVVVVWVVGFWWVVGAWWLLVIFEFWAWWLLVLWWLLGVIGFWYCGGWQCLELLG